MVVEEGGRVARNYCNGGNCCQRGNTSTVQLFDFENSKVRVVEIEGNPWFVAKDVCEVLSYRPHPNGGYQNTLRIDSSDEKKVLEKAHSPGEWVLFEGTSSRVALISESGLYKLVMRSDKPEAKRFPI